MTKFLENKALKRFLGIALTILLVVTLTPHIQPAYGNGEEPATTEGTTFTEEPSDTVAPEAEEPEGEPESEPEEAAVAGEEKTGEADGGLPLADVTAYVSKKAARAKQQSSDGATTTCTGSENITIESNKTQNYVFDGGTHTLTIKKGATLEGTIDVKSGATLNLKGEGTIKGVGDRSVIIVEDKGSALNLNPEFEGKPKDRKLKDGTAYNGLTIRGGKGTKLHMTDLTPKEALRSEYKLPELIAGGGILVRRNADGQGGAKLNMYGGIVRNNEAEAGGGIFIDKECVFFMSDGVVTANTAKHYGGGGIFTCSASDGRQTDKEGKDNNHATILAGTITNNTTNTTYDWGGGGIFVENSGILKIESALITSNDAQGLGGGISGCPHASVGIGDITEGAALFGNTAHKKQQPENPYLNILETDSSLDSEKKIVSGDLFAWGITKDKIWTNAFSQYGPIGEEDIRPYSRNEFTADKAKDYYCTKVSYIFGYDLGQKNDIAWTGYQAGLNGGKEVKISKGKAYVANDVSLGLTSTAKSDTDISSRKVVITGNKSGTHGGGIGCNGSLLIGDLGSREDYAPFSFQLKKVFQNSDSDHDQFELKGGEFKFELYYDEKCTKKLTAEVLNSATDANGKRTGVVTNGAQGVVEFKIDGEKYLKDTLNGATQTVKLYVKEVANSYSPSSGASKTDNITYDKNPHEVLISLETLREKACIVKNSVYLTSYAPKINGITIDGKNDSNGEFSIVNVLNLQGLWHLEANKHFYGDAANAEGRFTFTLQGAMKPGNFNDVDLASLVRNPNAPSANGEGSAKESYNDDGKSGFKLTGYNGAFGTGDLEVDTSHIVFPHIGYTARGDYWYLLTENGAADPTVYLIKVEVTKNADNKGYGAKAIEVYYASDVSARQLTKVETMRGEEPAIDFYNADTSMDFSLYSYSVNAMSNEPVDQQCLVDPKIIKQLDGRAIKADEFRFKLIQVTGDADGNVDWSDTSGPEISATTNDEFGMVDFDKANNQAAEGMDPCCLLFTAPGTYYYRVIEDADYKKDASVDYSDQVITFTVVIEQDGATGQLTATDMYYGYLDEAGQNVRYKEQYTDYENKVSDPSWVPSIADFPTLNPDWHPTMVNKAKAMDLKVRKTSVLDRTEGLEGATYGLFMVNESEQGDILLGSATSDADGWIYYQNVSLAAGNLYYFKEQAAPAGHTVSEFRSPFFYLEAQTDPATKITTYTMKYTDQKLVPGTAAEPLMALAAAESAEPVVEPLAATGADAAAGTDADTATGGPEFTDDGTMLFTYDHEGGVYDEATYVEFNKLDTRTHEWVEGAKLSIVEKDTGTVVTSWTSGKAPEKLQKVLNVGITYVLREDEAPENYQKADDVEFVIDQYGKVSITKGTENGNATISDSAITLYDTMLDAEEVVPVERETVREIPETGKTVDKLAKTGDMLPLAALGLLALVALAVAAVAARRGCTRKQGVHRR